MNKVQFIYYLLILDSSILFNIVFFSYLREHNDKYKFIFMYTLSGLLISILLYLFFKFQFLKNKYFLFIFFFILFREISSFIFYALVSISR